MRNPHDLYIDDAGQGGTPVVLLHSGGGNTTHWTAQLSHLRRTRRAIALDMPGHGRSPLPAEDWQFTVLGVAAAVADHLAQISLRHYVLVGHSMGGAVGLAIAGAHPDRVAGLLLLDPATDGRQIPQEEAAGLMAAIQSEAYAATVEGYWMSMIGASTPAVQAHLLADLRGTPRRATVGMFGALLTFDPVTSLQRYGGPKLSVITALNEGPAAYHRLVETLPSEKFEGTGHWLQLDAPDRVNAILDAFLLGIPER